MAHGLPEGSSRGLALLRAAQQVVQLANMTTPVVRATTPAVADQDNSMMFIIVSVVLALIIVVGATAAHLCGHKESRRPQQMKSPLKRDWSDFPNKFANENGRLSTIHEVEEEVSDTGDDHTP